MPPNGTVFDTGAGLVWLQNANCFGMRGWTQAMSSAAYLKSGQCGLTDGSKTSQWRLPAKDELVNRQRNQQVFYNIQVNCYWSSTEAGNKVSTVYRQNGFVGLAVAVFLYIKQKRKFLSIIMHPV